MPRKKKNFEDNVAEGPGVSPLSFPRESKSAQWNPMKIAVMVLSFFLLALLGTTFFFYSEWRSVQELKKEAHELSELRRKVGELMVLPNEDPTVATVTDKSQLNTEPFFQKAENGDKVLIFSKDGRAILYRPALGKIIDIAPVSVGQKKTLPLPETIPSPQTATTVSTDTAKNNVEISESKQEENASSSPTFALYNGTTKVGVTSAVEDKILATFPDVTVTKKEKATKNDYEKTLILDLSGKNETLVSEVADLLDAEVESKLPSEEVHPNTDILVIVGK